MKKRIYLWLCLVLCVIMLAACNGGTSQNEDSPNASTPGASETPGAGQNTDNGLGIADDVIPGQEQFHTNVYEDNTAAVEYVFVTGLPDEEIQNKLNDNIKDFCLWQWLYSSPDAEPDNNYYMGTSSYYVLGERYVSVVRLLSVYDEEHPVNGSAGYAREEISAATFDLTTGEAAGELVFGGTAYTMANAVDKFYQVYPDADDADAKAKFHDIMQEREIIYNYFLTELTLAVYIENDSGDGFYRFDAVYEDIPEMLSQELAALVQ
jgi:hypothetical protein